jgi:hypothetical protein
VCGRIDIAELARLVTSGNRIRFASWENTGIFPPMRSALLILLALFTLAQSPLRAADPVRPASSGEFVIVSGGVSLWVWEKWKAQPHDNWWMNFIRASRIRIAEIRDAEPDAQITWLVYRPAYITRARQENNELLSHIQSVRDAYRVKLVWFDTTSELISYLNSGQDRSRMKITDFEFFGHSNKACWMFDYSNNIDSASKVWLHEKDLGQLRRGIFARDAFIKSWSCHTGESMAQKFRSATGVPMIGAIGKTQYMTDELPILSSPNGRWTR